MSLAALLRRTYHLEDVGPEHPIRRAADELERLYRIERELGEVSRALGGDAYWMDPPDGGSVTIAEQVSTGTQASRSVMARTDHGAGSTFWRGFPGGRSTSRRTGRKMTAATGRGRIAG